jgi:hypothetical protein
MINGNYALFLATAAEKEEEKKRRIYQISCLGGCDVVLWLL